MIFDLGATVGSALLATLPSVEGFQNGLHNLVAATTERTAVFRSGQAEVTNWRRQAVTKLDLPARSSTLLLLGSSARMPRCVKLNNYWCIKRAGWQGELGADAEGHVAFDTAEAGARAAARLLRRYYLEFGRRSAHAIVSRWAPNRCLAGPLVATQGTLPRIASLGAWQRMSPAQRDQTFDRLMAERRRLAEARYKATIGAIAAAKRAAFSVRAAPVLRTQPRPLAPTVARTAGNLRAAGKPRPGGSKPVAIVAPILCAMEATRISSYARQAIVGIAAAPTDDLLLFDERGVATWRLARLMTNMASIEIGPQRIAKDLITPALDALADDNQETTSKARVPESPSASAIAPPPS